MLSANSREIYLKFHKHCSKLIRNSCKFSKFSVVGISFSTGDYRGITVLSIMEKLILKVINHTKYISKKNLVLLKLLII